MNNKYKRLKLACYTINISMSVVANLPPLLFLSFRSLYTVSFSLLGLLVLVNFVTQLAVDLIFSFFSHIFNISKTVKSMPYITFLGLLIYSVYPLLFPETAYIGLIIGTIVFSASAGLAEVLISPIIASIPSDDPDREMSKLHSVYAWGVVPVILITSLFFAFFSPEMWHYLVFLFMIIPLISMLLFINVKIPYISSPEKVSGVFEFLKDKTVWIYIFAIFFCGAAECTMAQWASSYLENALNITKLWGDIFGVALFALMLGVGRSLYAKRGENIIKVLISGSFGAAVCYFVCAIAKSPLLGLVACALTGLCTSMLWPGCLVVASDRFPKCGVLIYALMAAGGDMGAAVVPQLVGVVADVIINNNFILLLFNGNANVIEEIGMKTGMLISFVFPLSAFLIFLKIRKIRNNN